MNIKEFVQNALAEDVGRGDLFEATIEPSSYAANVIAKEDGVFAGEIYARELLSLFELKYEFFAHDGEQIKKGDKIVYIEGKNTDILKLERTLLNMLQHASGIATNAAFYAAIAAKHGVMLLDTRKTRPHLRVFEKHAVKAGGAQNHRLGLDDALMIKDTHRKAIKDMEAYIKNARKNIPFTAKIEIECESLVEVEEAIRLGADIIMCDNMNPSDVAKAVALKNKQNARILIECSGNIDKSNFEEYAKSGADAISIGAIIHKAVWLDFSMKGI